ncbi:hypothetical protein K469DRAFT_339110 [Zopfia rhizophila CBS 207.26]|uniref:Uncharacterized protein n=1 Tax=Zopfia rhizophila CBS 207.26 TaxID=1314779 RepID=A0A6A6DG50_9PEZI|nr:hypothetical protein K469DRAFT_339110 [Zopfia rhizophila CBS 207.26]
MQGRTNLKLPPRVLLRAQHACLDLQIHVLLLYAGSERLSHLSHSGLPHRREREIFFLAAIASSLLSSPCAGCICLSVFDGIAETQYLSSPSPSKHGGKNGEGAIHWCLHSPRNETPTRDTQSQSLRLRASVMRRHVKCPKADSLLLSSCLHAQTTHPAWCDTAVYPTVSSFARRAD